VLRETLDEIFPGKKITFVLGILADKDVAGIVSRLIGKDDQVIAVAPLSERATDPDILVGLLAAGQGERGTSITDAILRARNLAGPDGVVCIAGSLYLVGPARQIIAHRQNNLAKI
jgi:dihydrofolate synthase/folylpolyglutamate synthase